MTTENERAIVLDILLEIIEKKQYSHLVLNQALTKYAYLPKSSRAFISRLTKGCLEQLLELDWWIDSVSSVKTKKMKPVIRMILRMSAYQLLYMDIPEHAICNEAVKLAGKRGFRELQRFVNGVTRNLARQAVSYQKPKDLSVQYSVPKWLWSSMVEWYGGERVETMFTYWKEKRNQGICVHFHTAVVSTEEIKDSLLKQGVTVKEAEYASDCYYLGQVDRLEELEAFQNGWIQAQDISSALAAQCVGVKANDRCLDVCGAPGGKSIWMAEALLYQGGFVECRDLSIERLQRVEENKERCKLTNLKIIQADATICRQEDKEQFDCVLADVPCSGLGVIGRKPDMKYLLEEAQLKELPKLQRSIMKQAVQSVKPGGTFVYSTCTINPSENIENVTWLLQQKDVELTSLEPWIKKPIEGADLKTGMLQLLPGQNCCDGFFLARFKKKSN